MMTPRTLLLAPLLFLATACLGAPRDFDEATLGELCRNLYRWHLGDEILEIASPHDDLEFQIRKLLPGLDPDDLSLYYEIYIPRFRIRVELKKADYLLTESGQRVQNKGFRIRKVEGNAAPPDDARGYDIVRMNFDRLRETLFNSRFSLPHPDRALLEHLARTLQEKAPELRPELNAGEQVFHVAPISPISNTLWVYWESQYLLLRFSSDLDLDAPEFWALEQPRLRVYNLRDLSPGRDSAGHATMQRDQAARIVFNCLVFGERLVTRKAD